MYTAKRVSWRVVAPFAWRSVLFFLLYSTAICTLYVWAGWQFLALPFVPIGVIGTAVAFYVGFKNNSSYDRLWEGRRIWGSLVNTSRAWGAMVLDYVSNLHAKTPATDAELHRVRRELIYRHLAFLTALRTQLRSRTVWQVHGKDVQLVEHIEAFRVHGLDEELNPFLPENEVRFFVNTQNAATQLLKRQSAQLAEARDAGLLSDFYHVELERLLVEFYNQQGAAERIKSFPFPRQYAFFSYVFVWLFIWVLPYGLLNELAKVSSYHVWLTIPAYTVIAWIFNTMEVVGDTSENPFENGINDVPMTAVCRVIEIDLREMLGETDLPPRLQAIDNILM